MNSIHRFQFTYQLGKFTVTASTYSATKYLSYGESLYKNYQITLYLCKIIQMVEYKKILIYNGKWQPITHSAAGKEF